MTLPIVVPWIVALAQSPAPTAPPLKPAPMFAPPVRLKAGAAFLGHRRLYPSPVLHDVDGDKIADVVIGDLWGKLTVAKRLANGVQLELAAEKPIQGADGKELNFENW